MTTKQIIDAIRRLMARHEGGEKELYEALCAEAEGWEMRLSELEKDE